MRPIIPFFVFGLGQVLAENLRGIGTLDRCAACVMLLDKQQSIMHPDSHITCFVLCFVLFILFVCFRYFVLFF